MSDSLLSLEQLERNGWGEPLDATHLVRECHRLRQIPIGTLTVGELRTLIGQGIGPTHLIPLALIHLNADPFSECEYYAGDLLSAVLNTKWEFWEQNPVLWAEMQGVMDEVQSRLALIQSELLPAWSAYFR